MKILIIGGSGYIGNIVCRDLCLNNKVTNIDNQIYFKKFQKYFDSPNYKELSEDIRTYDNFRELIIEHDALILLGGLVGDPITKKYPSESLEINELSLIKIIDLALELKIPKIIFISTCSNYGKLKQNEVADENTELMPLSLYAKSKVKIEEHLIKNFSNTTSTTILRFATAFGLSPRMRYDLTVNQFVREAFYKKVIEVYDANTFRPYCHVKDFSSIIQKILFEKDSDRTHNQIFNAGGDANNCSKGALVEKIKDKYHNFEYKFLNNSEDQRNYIVNFSKIRDQINFIPEYSIADGIEEILNYLSLGNHDFSKKNEFGNYFLCK